MSDTVMKLKGIVGESKIANRQEWIDLLKWSWEVKVSSAATAAESTTQLGNLKAHKSVDRSSPLLMIRCATKTEIPECIIEQRKAGGKTMPFTFLIITLKSVYIDSYEIDDDGSDKDLPKEKIELNFKTITLEYREQADTGGMKGGAVMQTYTAKDNQAG